MTIFGAVFCLMEAFNLFLHFQFSQIEAEETGSEEVVNAGEDKEEVESRQKLEALINSRATERIEAGYGYNVVQAADVAWTLGAFAILTAVVCASEDAKNSSL